MSIQTEFFTLLIPIHHLVRELGFSATQKILLEVEHDDHLVHIGGTMDSADIPFMIESWKEKGLRPISGRGKSRRWHECCIVSRVSGPTMPCSWLKFDIETGLADWVSVERVASEKCAVGYWREGKKIYEEKNCIHR